METIAVVLKQPEQIELNRLALTPPTPDDVVVDVDWSGVSTGTERLLWSGRMPPFPGMGYPLVPGYESVGQYRRSWTRDSGLHPGGPAGIRAGRQMLRRSTWPVRRLRIAACRFSQTGGAARSAYRRAGDPAGALAATAYHAIAARGAVAPDCIVGHGVLGRLLARISIAVRNEPPVVWEKNPCPCRRRDRLRGAGSRT